MKFMSDSSCLPFPLDRRHAKRLYPCLSIVLNRSNPRYLLFPGSVALTIAVSIEAGIQICGIRLQNLELSLVMQVCISQSCSRACFPVVRVTIALSMAVRPAGALVREGGYHAPDG